MVLENFEDFGTHLIRWTSNVIFNFYIFKYFLLSKRRPTSSVLSIVFMQNENQTHSLFSKISSEDVSKMFNSLGPVSEHRPSHVSKSADMSSEIKIMNEIGKGTRNSRFRRNFWTPQQVTLDFSLAGYTQSSGSGELNDVWPFLQWDSKCTGNSFRCFMLRINSFFIISVKITVSSTEQSLLKYSITSFVYFSSSKRSIWRELILYL